MWTTNMLTLARNRNKFSVCAERFFIYNTYTPSGPQPDAQLIVGNADEDARKKNLVSNYETIHQLKSSIEGRRNSIYEILKLRQEKSEKRSENETVVIQEPLDMNCAKGMQDITDFFDNISAIESLASKNEDFIEQKGFSVKEPIHDKVKMAFRSYSNILDTLYSWNNGLIDPFTVGDSLDREISIAKTQGDFVEGAEGIGKLFTNTYHEVLRKKGYTTSQFYTLDDDVKKEIAEEVSAKCPLLNALASGIRLQAKAFVEEMDNVIKGIQEEYGKNNDIIPADTLEAQTVSWNSVIRGAFNKTVNSVQWASVNEIIAAFKDVGNQMKSKFEGDSKSRKNKVAANIAKLTTYSPIKNLNVADEFQAVLDKEDETAVSETISVIKRKGFSFASLFGKDGIIQSDDLSTKLAVITIGAERGWLYGINAYTIHNKIAGSINFIDLAGGDEKKAHELLQDFRAKNQSGTKSSIEAATNRVQLISNPDELFNNLLEQIENLDLPGVIGIVNRITDKGLYGPANMRAFIAIMRAMRENPAFRSCVTYDFNDQLAKSGMTHVAAGTNFLKGNRTQVAYYAAHANTLGFEHAGEPGKIITHTEKRLIKLNPELDPNTAKNATERAERIKKLDAQVVAILVGQTVKNDKGEHVSAWQPDFAFYRESTTMRKLAVEDIKNQDFDYFKQKPDPLNKDKAYLSGVFLRGSKVFDSIMTLTGEGKLAYGDNAEAFLEALLAYNKELLNEYTKDVSYQETYKQFALDTKAMFDKWVRAAIQQTYGGAQFALLRWPKGGQKHLCDTLYEAKLLSKDIHESATIKIKDWNSNATKGKKKNTEDEESEENP